MRIAIDARLNAYRRGGIPQYTRNLVSALAEIDRENQYISLQHRQMLRPLAVASNVRRHVVYTPPHNRFEPWSLPLELLPVRPTLLHCPDFVAPIRRRFPAVVTIHDLAFMQYPEILDSDARNYYGRIARSSASAEGVIAVSESTRQDIAQYLDIPIEHIDVVYEAAAPVFRPVELRDGEARVLNGEPVAAKSFMLFVSTLEPRKNLPTLLKALRIAIDRRPDRPYQLVVVGGRGWKDQPIFDAVSDLRLGEHVLFAGNVGVYDLRWLYNACRFYVNPSLYEGFGLPLLEAMASGAACLASATSSLPEIGGDAAIYVPPLEAGLWADAIEQLWDDEDRQQELGRLGTARAQRFSWQRAARETLKIYERVASGLPREAARVVEDPARQLAPVVGERAAATEAARACLRCGARLVPGELQHDLTIRRTDASAEYNVLASRAWVCPNCGQVELVSEWRALTPEPMPDLTPAPGAALLAETQGAEALVVASAEPDVLEIEADAEQEAVPVLSDSVEVTNETPVEQPVAEFEPGRLEPVEVEAQPEANQVLDNAAPTTDDETQAEQPVAEREPGGFETVKSEPELSMFDPVEIDNSPTDGSQEHAIAVNATPVHHALPETREYANRPNGIHQLDGELEEAHAAEPLAKPASRRGSRRKRR